MHTVFKIIVILLGSNLCSSAQQFPPVIKATALPIRILDGDDMQYGELVPSLRLDTYVAHPSPAGNRIVFFTDIDSISFFVQKGDVYDFDVVLNNRDTCHQRFTTLNPNKVEYSKIAGNRSGPDTIPFILKDDHAIHFTGSINGSPPLDLIFDTGASLGVLSEKGQDAGADVQDGNNNTFRIHSVSVAKSPVKLIDYHGRFKADGLLGYNAFEDKIVELNYDLGIMVVHDDDKKINLAGYKALPMIWRGSAIFFEVTIVINGSPVKALVEFDTGSRFSLSLTKSFCASQSLYKRLPAIGTRSGYTAGGVRINNSTVIIPQVLIAGFALNEVPADLEEPSDAGGLDFNIAGNDLLRRFNAVLDFQNGMIYLKPNTLLSTPYNKPFNFWIPAGVAMTLLAAGVYILLRRQKIKERHYQAPQG